MEELIRKSPAVKKLPRNKFILIGIVVILVCFGYWYFKAYHIGAVVGVKSDTYQAVFLTNGQAYFGRLAKKGGWLLLTDIYYLQATDSLQQSASASTPPANIQLIKLGSELHGPEDAMYIESDKVLFWENLKPDSKAIQAIATYQNNKK